MPWTSRVFGPLVVQGLSKLASDDHPTLRLICLWYDLAKKIAFPRQDQRDGNG